MVRQRGLQRGRRGLQVRWLPDRAQGTEGRKERRQRPYASTASSPIKEETKGRDSPASSTGGGYSRLRWRIPMVKEPRWITEQGRQNEAGIPLSDLHAHLIVDPSIDGADEIDPSLNLVKGRGGSLLRERTIQDASRRFVVIVDESKMVPRLGGSGLAVPVEVIPFCWGHTLGSLRSLFDGELRQAATVAFSLSHKSDGLRPGPVRFWALNREKGRAILWLWKFA